MAKHIGIDKILIPNATNRIAALLIVGEPADTCVIVEQYPGPRKETIGLARRPKVAEDSYNVVITIIVETVTRR